MSSKKRTEKRRRDRMKDSLRTKAIRAKERFKALALGGSLVMGGVVAIEAQATGYGSSYAVAAGFVAFVFTGAFFGMVALGIKVDEHHRKG